MQNKMFSYSIMSSHCSVCFRDVFIANLLEAAPLYSERPFVSEAENRINRARQKARDWDGR